MCLAKAILAIADAWGKMAPGRLKPIAIKGFNFIKTPIAKLCLPVILLAVLTSCYQVQVKGPVGGALLVITDLRDGEQVAELPTWDVPFLLGVYGGDTWAILSDFARLVFVGGAFPDKSKFTEQTYYLLTAAGGEDLDTDQNLTIDSSGTPVLSDWHALALGADLQENGVQVSALTEVVYQYLEPTLSGLTDTDLGLQLDLLAQRLVSDVEGDGDVDYRDLLKWNQLINTNRYLADDQLLADFEDAILSGDSNGGLRSLAVELLESGSPRSGCGTDHPKVGQSTVLTTRAHGVTGTVTIVDNCVLELTNFNFDGGGVVVQAYTGVDGNFFGPGAYAISADLVGPRYSNATLTLPLPAGVTLDAFNSFSIWCVNVGVSFGDGFFQ